MVYSRKHKYIPFFQISFNLYCIDFVLYCIVLLLGNSMVTETQLGHLFLVCIKYVALQEVTCGLFRKYHTVVSTYRINTVFQLPFNTKQRLERAVTDVRREMN